MCMCKPNPIFHSGVCWLFSIGLCVLAFPFSALLGARNTEASDHSPGSPCRQTPARRDSGTDTHLRVVRGVLDLTYHRLQTSSLTLPPGTTKHTCPRQVPPNTPCLPASLQPHNPPRSLQPLTAAPGPSNITLSSLRPLPFKLTLSLLQVPPTSHCPPQVPPTSHCPLRPFQLHTSPPPGPFNLSLSPTCHLVPPTCLPSLHLKSLLHPCHSPRVLPHNGNSLGERCRQTCCVQTLLPPFTRPWIRSCHWTIRGMRFLGSAGDPSHSPFLR